MEAWQASLNVALYGFVIANVVWYASACFGRNSVCLQLWNIVAQWRAPRAFLTDRRKSQNEFQKNLKSVIEQRRVEWARGALRTICMFAFVLVSAMLLLEVKEFPITAACFFVGGFASFAAQVFQHMLTALIVRLLYSCLMLVLVASCAIYLLDTDPVLETTGQTLRLVSRLCFGFLVMDFRLSVIWNVMYTLAFCLMFAFGPRGLDGSGNWTLVLQDAMCREAFVLAVIIAILRGRVMLLEAEAFSVAESQAFQNEGSAKTSLLKAMCDVVLVLDEELRIAEACPQLKHMLRTSYDLTGSMLHDHMPAKEDRERFDQFMAATTSTQEDLAEILNVRIRDRFGLDRQVELLRAKYFQLDSSVRHIVGIRAQVEDNGARPTLGSVPRCATSSTPCEGSETSFDRLMLENRITLSFDALGGTIVDHSLQFGVLFGKLMVGRSVEEVVSAPAQFWSWAQQCAMITFYGDCTLPACPLDHVQMRGGRFASSLRLPIRDVKIFRLPQKSFIDEKSGSKAAVVVSILFLTLRTKALLRLAAAQRETCLQRLSVGACAASSVEESETDEFDTSGSTPRTEGTGESLLAPGAEAATCEAGSAWGDGLSGLGVGDFLTNLDQDTTQAAGQSFSHSSVAHSDSEGSSSSSRLGPGVRL